MESAQPSETLMLYHVSIRRQNPQDHNLILPEYSHGFSPA